MKASRGDLGMKNGCHKYSVSALCKVLQVPRSTYYYESNAKSNDDALIEEIFNIFKSSRNNYGTQKIKIELAKKDYQILRRHIERIMKQEGLASNYTVAQFKL